MNRVKLRHILLDSKVHILAISTLICAQIASSYSLEGTALLYAVLAVWMVADYRLVLMVGTAKTALLAFALPAVAVSAVTLVLPWNNLLAGASRLMLVIILVAVAFDLLNETSAKRLGLVMAVVIEILVPVKDQPLVFVSLVLDSAAGVAVALLVGLVYYNLTEYSAYLKHKKKIFNEPRLCALIGGQLQQFFAARQLDWPLLRTEIKEFKDNRFFYNRDKSGTADQVKLFYDLVLEVYCLLTMLKDFQAFDARSIAAAQAAFPDTGFVEAVEASEQFYCENIGARAMLSNYQLLQDIISQRANIYRFE